MQHEETTEYPSIVTRFQSSAVDGVLMLISMFAFASLVGDNETLPGWMKAVVFVGFWLLYEPICTTYAATLGNYVMGVRVRNIDDHGKRISLRQAFIRAAVKAVLGGWSFFYVHFNPQRRAVHDIAAKSIVLEAKSTKK